MKNLFGNDISNWRLFFIILTFAALVVSMMREELGLTRDQSKYIKYFIYAFVILGYGDIILEKIKKKKPNSDILDSED